MNRLNDIINQQKQIYTKQIYKMMKDLKWEGYIIGTPINEKSQQVYNDNVGVPIKEKHIYIIGEKDKTLIQRINLYSKKNAGNFTSKFWNSEEAQIESAAKAIKAALSSKVIYKAASVKEYLADLHEGNRFGNPWKFNEVGFISYVGHNPFNFELVINVCNKEQGIRAEEFIETLRPHIQTLFFPTSLQPKLSYE